MPHMPDLLDDFHDALLALQAATSRCSALYDQLEHSADITPDELWHALSVDRVPQHISRDSKTVLKTIASLSQTRR